MEEELNRRQRAKEALCKFLASNEINKKIKEEERQKEMELDQRYMQEYAAMLDHQEATRHIQLEKLKAIQVRSRKTSQRAYSTEISPNSPEIVSPTRAPWGRPLALLGALIACRCR
eukprot:evm.model.scf_321.5 EVM.evm.TU.scf_321.5   scf_321:74820-75167(+)